ncbi:MAG: hypothetical protein ACJ8DZ_04170 [Allosphingosinicella sp.]
MTSRAKERLALGALCLLAIGWAFAGRDGRFGAGFDHYSWPFAGVTTGLLLKTFLPEPEKWDPISYGTRLAVSLIAIIALFGVVGVLAAL